MISEKIRARLDMKDNNASDLARYCGVSPQAANQWVKGDVEPRRKYKELIAAFFGITIQELEYGPVLSLTPLQRRQQPKIANPKVSAQVADLMVASELERSQKSIEYRQGMRDMIVAHLSKSELLFPFQSGTCQADAFAAGADHGQRLIDKIKP